MPYFYYEENYWRTIMDKELLKLRSQPDSQYLPVKPPESIQHEFKIRKSLIEQGIDRKIADAVIGYRPDQVPFIYKSEPHRVHHHRVRDDWTEGYELIPGLSALWIGTTDDIHNLVSPNGSNDQIREVIVQWRGSYITESEQQGEVRNVIRTEVKQLGDGRFVEIEYGGVSQMGAFDGTIEGISLHVPEGSFEYMGKDRKSYRIYEFRHNTTADLDGVPGAVLARKNGEQPEWSLDTDKRSNVSGTTILNGYGEMLRFHMSEISVAKADFARAYRFDPLPTENFALLPQPPEQQLAVALNEDTGIEKDRIMEVAAQAEELMRIIVPQALKVIAHDIYIGEAERMEIDGIMNHPEAIWILNKNLIQFSRAQRFDLARLVSKLTKEGHFTAWAQTLLQDSNSKFVDDTINRNTQHLLLWFKQYSPVDADLKKWIENAKMIAELVANGANISAETATAFQDLDSASTYGFPEYERVFDGAVTSLVGRYVEYVGQLYMGNSLE